MRPDRVFIIPVWLPACEVPDIDIDPVQTLRDLQHFDYFGRDSSIVDLIQVLDTARVQASGGMRPPIMAASTFPRMQPLRAKHL